MHSSSSVCTMRTSNKESKARDRSGGGGELNLFDRHRLREMGKVRVQRLGEVIKWRRASSPSCWLYHYTNRERKMEKKKMNVSFVVWGRTEF